MMDEQTVFVVDDDAGMRKSLRWLIESVKLNVETYASAQDFLEAYTSDRPGCLVLDIRLPGMSGLELQEKLVEKGISIPIIIITAHGDVPMAGRAMQSNAFDFIEKPINDQILLDRIQQALEKDTKLRTDQAARIKIAERMAKLSRREYEVMERVVGGKSSKEIAGELQISLKTVEHHRARLMKKMEAESVAILVQMVLFVSQNSRS